MWESKKNQYIDLNGVKIRTLSLDPAEIEVTVKTNAPGDVSVEILDGETVLAADGGAGRTFVLPVPNAVAWSPEVPGLYTCRVKFGGDEASETFGLRTISWGQIGRAHV